MAQENSNGFIENDSGEILSLRENEISGNMEIVWEPEDENAQKREDQKWLQRKKCNIYFIYSRRPQIFCVYGSVANPKINSANTERIPYGIS